MDYGVFCDEIEEYSKAVHYLNKAYKIFLTNFGNQNRDVSNVLTALGDHHLDVNNYKKAINNYQEALISFIEEFNESDIYTNPELHLIEPDLNIFYTLIGKAFAFYQLYKFDIGTKKDLIASLKTSQLAIQIVEIIKSSFGEENYQIAGNGRSK